MRRLVIVVSAAVLIAGCGVSKQVLMETEKSLASCKESLGACEGERDAARKEAQGLKSRLGAAKGREAKLEGDLEVCREGRTECEKAIEEVRGDFDVCRQRAEDAERGAEVLKKHEQQLRERLEKEIVEKTAQMELLNGKLSVQVLARILFNSGSAEILEEGKAILDKIAPNLASGEESIRIEGHADHMPIGPKIKDKWFSNWELSAARSAKVVRFYQYAHGIDPARMEAVGLSAFHPVANNESREGRQDNRRVVIILTAPK